MKNQRTYTKKQREMIDHNETIIEDNIFHAMKFPRDYTKKDIADYEREAKKELREFKNFLLSGGTPVFDQTTQMYIIPQKENDTEGKEKE